MGGMVDAGLVLIELMNKKLLLVECTLENPV